ncbi:MAG: hypothetical protein V4547_04220 [Bacteroidota bacterium]
MRIPLNKTKYFKGGWLLLIKVISLFAVVFIIEQILHLFNNADPLGKALIPFHNSYFSFSDHYLTSPGLSFEFSHTTSATFRFAVYLLFGYIGYALISIPIFFIPFLKKYSDKINSGLFYLLIPGCFLFAFGFPERKTILNMKEKEIIITDYNYIFIPSSEHIAFSSVESIQYNYSLFHDGYAMGDVFYLSIYLQTLDGRKINMGEIETAGDQSAGSREKSDPQIPPELKTTAEKVVLLLNEKIKL